MLVFAAASTADALTEIASDHERRHPGTKIRLSFGASSDLARQVAAGARADLFLSADVARVEGLRSAKKVALLSNQLVVVLPRAAKDVIERPEDLLRYKRVALADPEAVPAGVYAKAWLERAGVWSRLAARVVPTLDVRAALAAVEAGNAQVGIVYRTDASISTRVRVALAVSGTDAPAIVYPLVLLVDAPAATRFYEALQLPAARAVWQRHGFGLPER